VDASVDLNRLERQLRGALDAWRASVAQLRRTGVGTMPSPFAPAAELCAESTWRALAERVGDGRAEALALWGRALGIEHAGWPARVEQTRLWHEPHPGLGGEAEAAPSVRWLRVELLRTRSEAHLAGLAAALAQASPALSAAVARGLERRAEFGRAWSGAAALGRARGGVSSELGRQAAIGVLELTEPMAAEMRVASWWEGLRQTVGHEASDGWPAALGPRWLSSVFRATDLARVPRLSLGRLPAPWGASSFARALGAFGVGVLDAGRADCPSFAEHQPPYGVRRHVRFALFAGLCAERSFARRELGLGTERTRTHRRAVARAMLRALRLDALRVLCVEALAVERHEVAEQRFAELGPRAFGHSAPSGLLGVVPELRPLARCELVGRVLAASERLGVVERFGEDWYRNPRFGDWLRSSDLALAAPGAIAPAAVDAGLGALAQLFTEAL
jgi:hypothetical protein